MEHMRQMYFHVMKNDILFDLDSTPQNSRNNNYVECNFPMTQLIKKSDE
ncbi:MAG: hypothetical protein ACI82S_003304 [Patiriisocius sp.]|jgi:hypothetical protein